MPLFNAKKRWGVIISGALLSSIFLAACDTPRSILDPAGPVASEESSLFWIILIIATIIFVLVEGWLIFSTVRYRERPNMPVPRQVHGNNTIEIMWTIAPSIVLFIVLAFTIRYMFALVQPAGNKLEVRAVGHQWWWEFDYPNQHVVTADTLYVPKGTIIQVDLVSNNVIHSFWVPSLTGKTDVIPSHNNTKWFQADKAGTYAGECAEYCGTQHAHMDFSVVVFDTQDEFNTWISGQQQAAQTSSDSLVAKGAQYFAKGGGCTGCHGIVGVNLKSFDDPAQNGLVGPNLTHFGSRGLIAGAVLTAAGEKTWADDPSCRIVNGKVAHPDTCGLYQWLKDPQGVKPGNDMQVNIDPGQLDALVAYLESLK